MLLGQPALQSWRIRGAPAKQRTASRAQRASAGAPSRKRLAVAVLAPDKPAQAAPQQASIPIPTQRAQPPQQSSRLRVVVLGTGWASVSFIKALRRSDR